MTSIRINVDSTARGDLEATTDLEETMGDSFIREGIIETANRVLRGYGLKELGGDE